MYIISLLIISCIDADNAYVDVQEDADVDEYILVWTCIRKTNRYMHMCVHIVNIYLVACHECLYAFLCMCVCKQLRLT